MKLLLFASQPLLSALNAGVMSKANADIFQSQSDKQRTKGNILRIEEQQDRKKDKKKWVFDGILEGQLTCNHLLSDFLLPEKKRPLLT